MPHSPLHLWYSDTYSFGIDEKANFPRLRYKFTRDLLEHDPRIVFNDAPKVSIDDITRIHDMDYVYRFLEGSLSEKEQRAIGLRPWKPDIVPRTLHLVGGTLAATKRVIRNGGFAGNLAGGTHHAFADRGAGYCIFNDLAVCARYAQVEFGFQNLLIIDLDVHQGDGTASIFRFDDQVHTFSMHCGKNFPFRKQKSDWDIPVETDISDQQYLEVLEEALEVLFAREPELIFYQAGVDPLADDRLGRLSLSRETLQRRNHMVLSRAHQRNIPMVLTMGGGYSEPIQLSAQAHADVFRQAAAMMTASASASSESPDGHITV